MRIRRLATKHRPRHAAAKARCRCIDQRCGAAAIATCSPGARCRWGRGRLGEEVDAKDKREANDEARSGGLRRKVGDGAEDEECGHRGGEQRFSIEIDKLPRRTCRLRYI